MQERNNHLKMMNGKYDHLESLSFFWLAARLETSDFVKLAKNAYDISSSCSTRKKKIKYDETCCAGIQNSPASTRRMNLRLLWEGFQYD